MSSGGAKFIGSREKQIKTKCGPSRQEVAVNPRPGKSAPDAANPCQGAFRAMETLKRIKDSTQRSSFSAIE
jgi:hypothetical protein